MPLSRFKAEQALGKSINSKHPVHHFDGDTENDKNNNLVVCEDTNYHLFLHKRKVEKEKIRMSVYKIKKCDVCEKDYLGHIASKTCSKCKQKEYEKIIQDLVCPYCGTEFSTTKTNKRFCSKYCRKEFHREAYYG